MRMQKTILMFGLLAVGAVAVPVLCPDRPALAEDTAGGKHPHFDDGGVLSWTTKLADAQRAAKEHDRLILIEYGREA